MSYIVYDGAMSKIVVLDSIRSAYNVGAIFRTADGAGVKKILLSGYTPAPRDRFGREHAQIKKTSLGASSTVEWQSIPDNGDCIDLLNAYKQDGYKIVAVEQAEQSVSLADFSVPEKVVYIFGNEISGVSKDLLNVSDVVLELPMRGEKESLNVSVVAGIVLYQ